MLRKSGVGVRKVILDMARSLVLKLNYYDFPHWYWHGMAVSQSFRHGMNLRIFIYKLCMHVLLGLCGRWMEMNVLDVIIN